MIAIFYKILSLLFISGWNVSLCAQSVHVTSDYPMQFDCFYNPKSNFHRNNKPADKIARDTFF
ncbi:MAG: hypothetical protein ABIP80_00525, partial [Ferruginibacter sp.]